MIYAFGGFVQAVRVRTLHTRTVPIVTFATSEADALLFAKDACHGRFPVGEYANHAYKIVGKTNVPVKFVTGEE